jgi:peptidoglycan/LPS O-acetylase OafA/YrhL
VAALWVVSFHVSGLWQGEIPLAGMGYLGVDLFFILSGFVLAHVHGEALRRDPLGIYPHFLGRRIARIFPVWLVVLVVFALKHRATMEPEYLFIYAILAQAWGGVPTQLLNPPGWSVSLEWAGYLLFPLIAFAPLRIVRLPQAVALISGMLALLLAGYLIAGGISIHDNEDWYALRAFCEFSIGIALCRMMTVVRVANADRAAQILAVVLLTGAAIVPLFGRSLTADLLFVAGFAAWLFLLAQATHLAQEGPLSRLLQSRPVRWLGERSYSLYVVHWLVLELLWQHADSGAVPKPLAAALMVGGAIAGAAILYAAIEQPARRYLRQRLG